MALVNIHTMGVWLLCTSLYYVCMLPCLWYKLVLIHAHIKMTKFIDLFNDPWDDLIIWYDLIWFIWFDSYSSDWYDMILIEVFTIFYIWYLFEIEHIWIYVSVSCDDMIDLAVNESIGFPQLYQLWLIIDHDELRKIMCRRLFRVKFQKPDPAFRRHALAVCKICKVDDKKAELLLRYANGNWASRWVCHYCTFGCCNSSEDRFFWQRSWLLPCLLDN